MPNNLVKAHAMQNGRALNSPLLHNSFRGFAVPMRSIV
jgi:hypothetical protein